MEVTVLVHCMELKWPKFLTHLKLQMQSITAEWGFLRIWYAVAWKKANNGITLAHMLDQ